MGRPYSKLSPKAKEKAREWYEETSQDWRSDQLDDLLRMELEGRGLPNDHVNYNLSHSPGDGVAFYGHVDVLEYLEKNKLIAKWKSKLFTIEGHCVILLKISQTGYGPHYHHHSTMTVYWEYDHSDNFNEAKREPHCVDFCEEFKAHIRRISQDLETQGYAEMDYRSTEEEIEQHMESNGYKFCECGSFLS